ncbi:unnamed protein product [Arabis nemorensis]|uniref:Uncharacterized protein n=1 Tax=Arabis nemorensis TaxID=586526 RepID=A0A565CNS5_9BRAS|nr:unnamed protein product [Arabis nemorensis]
MVWDVSLGTVVTEKLSATNDEKSTIVKLLSKKSERAKHLKEIYVERQNLIDKFKGQVVVFKDEI